MEIASFDGPTRERDVPKLPGEQAADPSGHPRDEAPAGSLASARAGTFQRTGYAGLVPPLLAQPDAPPSTPGASADADEAPSLSTSEAPIVEGATQSAAPTASAEPEVAPVNPNTGLPMHPIGAVTETPQWKRRQSSTPRRALRVFLLVALIAILVLVILAGFNAYRPSDTASSAEPARPNSAITEPSVGDAAVRPEVAALIDELESSKSSEAGGQIPPSEVSSYYFAWVDPFGFGVTAGADSSTGDFKATVAPNTELIRADGRNFARIQDGPWIELSPEAGEAIPSTLLDGPLEIDELLPPEVSAYVVAEDVRSNGQQAYLIDDALLAAELPAARTRWLTPWGLLPDAPVTEPVVRTADVIPEEAAPGDVIVTVRAGSEGVVRGFSISSPAIGGTAGYVLNQTDARPLTIATPAPFASE